jgi:hypothetical protein
VRQPLSDTTQTWTQQVAGRLRDHPLDTTAFRVRGPFDLTFNSVLTPGATATILVGAGSGMTAAESLLRELVQRRVALPTDAHPDVCFIWSALYISSLWGVGPPPPPPRPPPPGASSTCSVARSYHLPALTNDPSPSSYSAISHSISRQLPGATEPNDQSDVRLCV